MKEKTMSFGNIFKGVAQQAVDAALPAIKATLLERLTVAISKAGLPTAYQSQAIIQVHLALDAWTIKL
jgi:hypothetical protein